MLLVNFYFGLWLCNYYFFSEKYAIFSHAFWEAILIKLKRIINGAVVSEIDMKAGNFSIGRNHGNSLQLDDGDVSGEHALLMLVPNSYLPEQLDITIRDLGSTNGTYVNNVPVKEKEIKHGDAIRICDYEYRVFDDQSNVGTQTEYSFPEE
jgi:pSer/pThr/pTyr-binding forkhead associated (FHA) protein